MKKNIKDLTYEDFIYIIPSEVIENVLGKRELNHFNKFIGGQTVSLLKEQGGIYITDLMRFLAYRKAGLAGRKMPLDD